MTHIEALNYLSLLVQEHVTDIQATRPALAISLADYSNTALQALAGALTHYEVLLKVNAEKEQLNESND